VYKMRNVKNAKFTLKSNERATLAAVFSHLVSDGSY